MYYTLPLSIIAAMVDPFYGVVVLAFGTYATFVAKEKQAKK